MSTLITVEHLYRYYGPHCAVNDVSFTLSKGQVLGFLGPNGAGKTTTLQILCGNLAPSAGRIAINGYALPKQAQLAKRHLGYLPDTPPLYKDLTVDEFLSYCARLHGIARPAIAKAVAVAEERCALGTVRQRLIGNLSKGFQQRVGLAQAIVHNPEVIVLDEPTVGLDPLQIREIRSLISELGQDHAVVLSTHRLSEVQAACTHVQIIHQGQLILSESVTGLMQAMTTGSLQVTTRHKPDLAVLLAIPGVTRVEAVSDQQFNIYHQLSPDPTQHIAEVIIANGWELQSLAPIKKSMEDIFIALTQGNDGCP